MRHCAIDKHTGEIMCEVVNDSNDWFGGHEALEHAFRDEYGCTLETGGAFFTCEDEEG